MKNITLSVPDELLEKGREYAREHNTSLNQMIREFLISKTSIDKKRNMELLFKYMDSVKAKSNEEWTRDELHER